MTFDRRVPVLAPPYHVQSTAETSRGGFPYFAHHDSVSALWSHKWRAPCTAGIYPFVDADVGDFEPIVAALRADCGDDPGVLYRPDEYAKAFLPVAQHLVARAEDSASGGADVEARDFYLRAAAVYRIARFPINRSTLSQDAWELGKAAYEAGGALMDPPIIPLEIPFSAADVSAGDLDVPIKAYLRVPSGTKPPQGWPILLFICGLDAYKTDNTQRIQQHIDHGRAVLIFEIPGTGDSPAAPHDPASADRLMGSVIDWVQVVASEHGFDQSRILARGISTGGYYAFRIAHTHGDRDSM